MKKNTLLILTFSWLMLSGCSIDGELDSPLNTDVEMAVEDTDNDTTGETSDDSEESGDTDNSNSGNPITTDLRTFIFGHSLIVHDPPLIATPSNETTVPHWIAELSVAAGFDYAVSGQYGFLPQHANLPPIAQWGFDRAEGAWDSDNQTFADANFNSILFTAGNFIQYQSALTPYDGDNPDNATPISATLEILDWVEQQEPGTAIYIYENWPDMAGFLSNGVPATTSEFENYNQYTQGEFHDWWIAYHEAVIQERPDLNVKMIPVGPIIAKLMNETDLSNIPFSELYEDDAPHGRPTIYFLASMITYMGMYGVETPSDFQVPETVHAIARDNYEMIVDFIWNELENFNDNQGNSLVFP
ncbi:T9SS C-terminal target domain-containing protein [Maribacter algarum]|uniref:T9SS C-terminal target domain-containing protein n=1 Tax=Maribacter algarum (ex Zhang et al. 2020) TaxID=2578118 RepID=A0A5S3PW19_9FLAO|nr:T9SS C-terminal target domain-containing protein [Maribacter algarum]TMM57188.1 T9SS C-terminal target domain-containing protein [Maribacter algarum]